MQFALLGLKEVRTRIFERSPYSREVFALRDGGKVALDWVLPSEDVNAPVCVLLHGATQDSASVTMTDLSRSLAARGFPVVVMNRRGYGGLGLAGGEVKMALFGFDEDLDDVIEEVGTRYPGRPVAVVGFSCGSGYAGRYVGKRQSMSAWLRASGGGRRGPLLCAVAYDPGYDTTATGAITRLGPPYSWALNFAVKYQYVFRHRAELRQKSPSMKDLVDDLLSPKSGLKETYKRVRRLSGAGDSSQWLDLQQPQLDAITVPCLCINSRDDPICVWGNVEAHAKDISANPNMALAELHRGSHGCKFDFWGYSQVSDAMIGDFVMASWEELLRK